MNMDMSMSMEEHKRTRQALLNKSFEKFTEEFLRQDLDTRTKIIEKVKDNYLYKIRYYDLSGDYISFMEKLSVLSILQFR